MKRDKFERICSYFVGDSLTKKQAQDFLKVIIPLYLIQGIKLEAVNK
jgi:hypothetical protein